VLERRLAFASIVYPRIVPAGTWRHIEVFARVLIRVFEVEGDVGLRQTRRLAFLLDLFATLIEQIAGALEEQHAKDVFLVLAGIHVAAQIIACREQQTFQAGECEFGGWHRSVCSSVLVIFAVQSSTTRNSVASAVGRVCRAFLVKATSP
jgi:hypothetical protein